MQQPVVSIVIATYNRATLLRETVRSVLDQRSGTVPFEVIVVDNNSGDDTAAVVGSMQASAGPTLRYVKETQQGNAYARNTGIRHASGSIIAFTDDQVLGGRVYYDLYGFLVQLGVLPAPGTPAA